MLEAICQKKYYAPSLLDCFNAKKPKLFIFLDIDSNEKKFIETDFNKLFTSIYPQWITKDFTNYYPVS